MLLELLCLALASTPLNGPEQVITSGEKAVSAMGTYSFRMLKRERVKGELHAAQEILATVREVPFAVRLDFIKGPARGRRVLYNSSLRHRHFRVREAGLLSIFGGVWIDVDTTLGRSESNHTVLEAGLGNLIRRFKRDHLRARAVGGFGVKDEGNGCALWTSPNHGAGFGSATTRVCTNPATGLPSRVEAYDSKGALIESYEFFDTRRAKVGEDFFTPEGARL